MSDTDRQIRLIMLMMSELKPGSVCMDTSCPQAQEAGMPHMANDGGNHPHPYGLISTSSYEWRRKPWWRLKRA